MNTILTDSMARDHLATIQASAAASRRAREARSARRAARRRGSDASNTEHHRVATVGHVAARPFTAAHNWLVAGQL